MRNSAVLKEHRRQGLYTALLETNLELVREKGFQKIFSRHNATNNAVIIPKLKAGFIISSLELDDMFGTLIHLSYYTNPLSGDMIPDEQMQKALGFSLTKNSDLKKG